MATLNLSKAVSFTKSVLTANVSYEKLPALNLLFYSNQKDENQKNIKNRRKKNNADKIIWRID